MGRLFRECGLTWAEGCPSSSQHTVAAHLEGLGEVQVVEDEQVPWGSGDEHLGTVGCQTHPHQVAGVEELFVRAAILCKPAGEKQLQTSDRQQTVWRRFLQHFDVILVKRVCSRWGGIKTTIIHSETACPELQKRLWVVLQEKKKWLFRVELQPKTPFTLPSKL